MIRVFSYNPIDPAVFPYQSGTQMLWGVPVLIVPEIFTCEGRKGPEYVTRQDKGYQLLSTGLVPEDTIIGFFGKESSGATAALCLMLEDRDAVPFRFRPRFCRHVDVLTQSMLIQRGIEYDMFIDYSAQCREWMSLEDALWGEIVRSRRS